MLVNASEDFLKLETERRARKEMQRAADDRVLDPWERYRAVSDHCDRLLDLTELYDRKTRFALMILGTLNATNVLVASRGDIGSALRHGHLLLGAYVGCYALVSVVLLWYAITALRPSASHMAAVDVPLDEYCDEWKQMQVGRINRQLAASSYELARSNAMKLASLDRLYAGLKLLAVLTAVLIVALAMMNVPRV